MRRVRIRGYRLRTPEQYHRKRHKNDGVEFNECRKCANREAACKAKESFNTIEECLKRIREFNATMEYEQTAYLCNYCFKWHRKTNRTKGAPAAPNIIPFKYLRRRRR